MSDIVTLWFDKDGVLAQYDYSLYEAEYGAPAPWLVHNAHVFRNLDPYDSMCEAFRMLYAETRNVKMQDRLCNMRVLTGVSDGITLAEHVLDGARWCKENVDLSSKDFYACAISKENIPVGLRSEITAYDVLLDDYMPNLEKWAQAEGTAIKVLNGINSRTDKFPYVLTASGANYLYDVFRQIVSDISKGIDIGTGHIVLRNENKIKTI